MYRILTEDLNRAGVYAILDSHVNSYTVTPAVGSWKGVREDAIAIDLVDVEPATVYAIAAEIKAANKQESVLVLGFKASAAFL